MLTTFTKLTSMSIVPTVHEVSRTAPPEQEPGSPSPALRVGIVLGRSAREPRTLVEVAQGAERLGFDSVWSSEAWGWDLFLAGDRAGAAAAVSDELVDDLALVGPAARVREQLAAWRSSPVDLVLLELTGATTLDVAAAAVLG